jgi:hypothetical protein
MAVLILKARSHREREVMTRFVEALAGRTPFAAELVRGVQIRVGMTLLSLAQADFVTKARGGTGKDGIRWDPLKPSTIAQRRTTAAERKALGITGKRVRGLLTPAEDKRWRMIFASRKAYLIAKFGLGEREASAQAAQIAWATLKAAGAKTKLQVLGGRVVEMLRDTGRLFNSLSPALQGSADQVFRMEPGAVTVGTNVVYAARQHRMRPFWPVDGRLPEAWVQPVMDTLRRGIMEAVAVLMARGAGAA